MIEWRKKKKNSAQRELGAPQPDVSLKIVQYIMLAVLFAVAVVLPAYGGKMRVQESAEIRESGVQTGDNQTQSTQSESDTQPGTGSEQATIVLDAGHGGIDPGMTGASGVAERELNLIYAKKLQVLLEEAGYRVVQTRETQDGLYDEGETNKKAQDMQRRCAVIEQEQPLLTVSIHQNSYPNDSSVRGPQVFYYENSAEGERLAACIQSCMNEQLDAARSREPKGNGSYYILKRSASTTVIVECGFLSNPDEDQLLQQEDYQNRVVRAICDGVLEYLGGEGSSS